VDEATATDVVEKLRARRIFASLNRRAGVYNVGVRVVIPDGREAIWDNDGAAGLEAMVLRDGVLVGFVPQIPDSENLDAAAVVEIIAATDYDAPVSTRPPTAQTKQTESTATGSTQTGPTETRPAPPPPAPPPPAPPPPAPPPPAPPRGRWRDRLRRP
jgi:hypothetical protein